MVPKNVTPTLKVDFFETGILPYKIPSPRMKLVLVMIEPNTLPNAKSVEPLAKALIVVANSGKLVPNDTMVAPIMTSEIPKDFEITIAASVK